MAWLIHSRSGTLLWFLRRRFSAILCLLIVRFTECLPQRTPFIKVQSWKSRFLLFWKFSLSWKKVVDRDVSVWYTAPVHGMSRCICLSNYIQLFIKTMKTTILATGVALLLLPKSCCAVLCGCGAWCWSACREVLRELCPYGAWCSIVVVKSN